MNADLAMIHDWANDILNSEEGVDRTLLLEGVLQMINDVISGIPVDFAYYNRMYIC